MTIFDFPKDPEFVCPFGVSWDGGSNDPRTVPSQPTHKAGQVFSFLKALVSGARVPPDVRAMREAICADCDKLRIPADGSPAYCGMCGCQVSADAWQVRNLAAYEENLPHWGCKHPLRGWTDPSGKRIGWPLSRPVL